MIISELSKTEGIEWSVISDIRDGGLQKYILRPINYIVYQFVYVLSKKIVVLICIGINIIPMIILFHQYLDFNNIFIRCVFFGVATFGALLMVYLFNVSIALLSFWFTEFTAIFHFLPFGVAFLNGTLLPLDIMPSWLFNVLSFTPFYYMIYFPAQVLNGQIVGLDCLTNFIGMIMVLGVEGLIVTVVWNCGIKKFSAIGG